MQSYLLNLMYLLMIVTMASVTLGSPWPFSAISESHIGVPSEKRDIKSKNNKNLLLTPGTRITQHPESLEVVAGKRVELQCEAVGHPSPRLFWIYGKDSGKQRQEVIRFIHAAHEYARNLSIVSSKLTIDCITTEDQGPVYCISVSGSEMAQSKTELKVNTNEATNCNESENKPTITFYARSIFAHLNSTAILPCRFMGKQTPDFYWFDVENRTITSTIHDRYTVLSNGDLQITNLQWSDMGTYTCMMRSSSMKENASIFLYPVQPEKVNKTSL